MNITQKSLIAACLLASVGISQQASASEACDPGEVFINRLEGQPAPSFSRCQPGAPQVTGGSNEQARVSRGDYYGLYQGGSGSQNIFRRTEGLGLAEMAGFGGVNSAD